MAIRGLTSVREHYQRDGFYVYPAPVIPEDVVRRAVAGMDALRAGEYDTGRPPQPSPWNPGDDPNLLCKIEMPQIASHAIRELVSHTALGEAAAQVTGARAVQVWWVQLLFKPPAAAESAGKTNVGWHQDYQYWKVWQPDSELFTAWVALSDVNPRSGPMHFVVGSHHWGELEAGDFFEQDYEGQRETIRRAFGQEWEEEAAVLRPGGVSFHHKAVFHGSGPNLSSTPRRSFAIHLRTERSSTRNGARDGLARFIDNLDYCPVIYGDAADLG